MPLKHLSDSKILPFRRHVTIYLFIVTCRVCNVHDLDLHFHRSSGKCCSMTLKCAKSISLDSTVLKTLASFITDVHSPLLFAFCLFIISCHKSCSPPSRDLSVSLLTFLTSSGLLLEIFLYSLPYLL